MKRVILLILIVLAVVLAVHFSTPATPETDLELQQRLDLLVEQLEQQRQTHHVAGMAIAVVKDDEVVLTLWPSRWSRMTKWSSLMGSGWPASSRKRQ
jgi:hypothetical protein